MSFYLQASDYKKLIKYRSQEVLISSSCTRNILKNLSWSGMFPPKNNSKNLNILEDPATYDNLKNFKILEELEYFQQSCL